ncbi:hypothetical protein NDU88_005629 [Pleurodeles waltl]|uniref:Uncharacterized protein n=1 Tax=Pleurodeles waltl TaxID=8319 RepID=A0AAV7TUW2_PLEWA|nr:hypothetical protein NDU88_005629 [Pleurodeles waltl]
MSARMEEKATVNSEILVSIVSRRRPTAAISCSMRSVTSNGGEAAGDGAEPGEVPCVAMALGCARASENSKWRECLPEDFPLGISDLPKMKYRVKMHAGHFVSNVASRKTGECSQQEVSNRQGKSVIGDKVDARITLVHERFRAPGCAHFSSHSYFNVQIKRSLVTPGQHRSPV